NAVSSDETGLTDSEDCSSISDAEQLEVSEDLLEVSECSEADDGFEEEVTSQQTPPGWEENRPTPEILDCSDIEAEEAPKVTPIIRKHKNRKDNTERQSPTSNDTEGYCLADGIKEIEIATRQKEGNNVDIGNSESELCSSTDAAKGIQSLGVVATGDIKTPGKSGSANGVVNPQNLQNRSINERECITGDIAAGTSSPVTKSHARGNEPDAVEADEHLALCDDTQCDEVADVPSTISDGVGELRLTRDARMAATDVDVSRAIPDEIDTPNAEDMGMKGLSSISDGNVILGARSIEQHDAATAASNSYPDATDSDLQGSGDELVNRTDSIETSDNGLRCEYESDQSSIHNAPVDSKGTQDDRIDEIVPCADLQINGKDVTKDDEDAMLCEEIIALHTEGTTEHTIHSIKNGSVSEGNKTLQSSGKVKSQPDLRGNTSQSHGDGDNHDETEERRQLLVATTMEEAIDSRLEMAKSARVVLCKALTKFGHTYTDDRLIQFASKEGIVFNTANT
ncbi:hypothetical protein SARC_00489, partial [Sphaeroforma arctica JP610]